MTPSPSPEQQIVGCSLSNYLADRRNQIVAEWMKAVLCDPSVPAADELTLSQLRDHVPQILDELNSTLEDAFNLEVRQRAEWRASTHGLARWEQSYNLAQLIREIGDLRTVLIHHLAEFHDERMAHFPGRIGVFANVVLHSYFDRLICGSVEQFLAASKGSASSS